MKRFVPLTSFLLLIACAGLNTTAPEPPMTDLEQESTGSILTGRSQGGVTLADLTGANAGGTGLPINALLWRASLDLTAVLPIDDIDVFSGSIITEWYSLPKKQNERIKLAVFVLDRELRSDGVRTVVYVQRRKGNRWIDAGIDNDLGIELEDLILTRARELRAATALQSSK